MLGQGLADHIPSAEKPEYPEKAREVGWRRELRVPKSPHMTRLPVTKPHFKHLGNHIVLLVTGWWMNREGRVVVLGRGAVGSGPSKVWLSGREQGAKSRSSR